jgi:predicted DsbA family dithiol-disulfide isomerase
LLRVENADLAAEPPAASHDSVIVAVGRSPGVFGRKAFAHLNAALGSERWTARPASRNHGEVSARPDRFPNLEIFYDFNCPYCRLSRRLLFRFSATFAAPVEWRPFELLPDVSKTGAPWTLAPSEMAAFRRAVADRATQIQHPITVPPFRPNTFDALRLAEAAKTVNAFDSFQEQVFDAYWTFGEDIGDHATLRNLAAATGMDSGLVSATLESEAFATVVRDSTERLRRIEYAAIPTFLWGDLIAFGLESEGTLVRFLEEYWSAYREERHLGA